MIEKPDWLPERAAHIWTVGDEIFLNLPPAKGRRGHTVRLPNNDKGLGVAITILRDREHQAQRTVSTKGAPTQYQIWAALRKKQKEDAAAKLAAAAEKRAAKQSAEVLKDLGGRKGVKKLLKELGLK